jgi:hypothetical protein
MLVNYSSSDDEKEEVKPKPVVSVPPKKVISVPPKLGMEKKKADLPGVDEILGSTSVSSFIRFPEREDEILNSRPKLENKAANDFLGETFNHVAPPQYSLAKEGENKYNQKRKLPEQYKVRFDERENPITDKYRKTDTKKLDDLRPNNRDRPTMETEKDYPREIIDFEKKINQGSQKKASLNLGPLVPPQIRNKKPNVSTE